ncbi:Sortase family protein [Jiangella alkaliphila]|uniref:Sortase family protein n=1 Tax=Jiangella alkaliphila TaxID=419479 RepID=A0A1H2L6R3_9ACTN|nr:sortase [Jiangella alkaliphila]SDU76757.1 Sortase family protein [Jiangella alkaliphila]
MIQFRTWAGGLGVAAATMVAACVGPTASPTEGSPPPEPPRAASVPAPVVEPTPVQAPVVEPVGPAPVSVSIDAIGVTSALVELGLDADGRMEVPAAPDLAGWYAPGARPGAGGPTVIVGHVDSVTGPAVFARLSDCDRATSSGSVSPPAARRTTESST